MAIIKVFGIIISLLQRFQFTVVAFMHLLSIVPILQFISYEADEVLTLLNICLGQWDIGNMILHIFIKLAPVLLCNHWNRLLTTVYTRLSLDLLRGRCERRWSIGKRWVHDRQFNKINLIYDNNLIWLRINQFLKYMKVLILCVNIRFTFFFKTKCSTRC